MPEESKKTKKKTTRKPTDFSIVERGQLPQSAAVRSKVEGVPDRAINGMQLHLDQIKPFERNPRKADNPEYETIKESIQAVGLKNRLSVTKRPNDDEFVLSFGGGTRYKILKELYEETGDKKFYHLKVDYAPYTNEMDLLAWHMAENDSRGEVTFFDKANAAIEMRTEWLKDNPGKEMSSRVLSTICKEHGWSNASHTLCSLYIYTVDVLADLIPNGLSSGFGSNRLSKIRSHATSISTYTLFLSDPALTEDAAMQIWHSVLLDHDDPDLFNLDHCWMDFARLVSEKLNMSLVEVETQLEHIREHGKPYDGKHKYVEAPKATKSTSENQNPLGAAPSPDEPNEVTKPQPPSDKLTAMSGQQEDSGGAHTEISGAPALKKPTGPVGEMQLGKTVAAMWIQLHPLFNHSEHLGWLIRGETKQPPYFTFRENLFIENFDSTFKQIHAQFNDVEKYTLWRLALFQLTFRMFVARTFQVDSPLDQHLNRIIRSLSGYQSFHCVAGASEKWTEQANLDDALVQRFHELQTVEANFDVLVHLEAS